MYQACIFDLDGTLANTLKSIAYFSNSALVRCGRPEIPVERYRTLVGNGVARQVPRMLDVVCGAGNYTEEDVDKLKDVYLGLYDADPTHLVERYDGMTEAVARLREMGLRLAVLSNKPHAWTVAVVNSLYPEGTFDRILGQQEGLPRKPSPEGALRIAGSLHIAPADVLYVGDTNTDMETGAAAGMDTVGVLWGFRTRKELEENHARYIVQDPGELVGIAASRVR